MKRSTDRFLTTHTGSLPRPDDLIRMMYAKEEGVPVDAAALSRARGRRRRRGRAQAGRQRASTSINDGEMSKPSYATYIKDRLSGFGGTGNTFVYQDLADFPNLAKRVFGDPGRSRRKTPACNAAIGVRDPQAAQADVDHLKAALADVEGEGSVHDGGVARRGVAVLPQRALPDRGSVPVRDRRGDAAGVRDDRQGAASSCRSTAPTSAWDGTSSMPT